MHHNHRKRCGDHGQVPWRRDSTWASALGQVSELIEEIYRS